MRASFLWLMVLLMSAGLGCPKLTAAQEASTNVEVDRSGTGGAQTLEDILRRQRGEPIDDSFRSNNIGGDASSVPGLGPLGGASDPELWRALRYNKADITVSDNSEVGKVLVQDGGMRWYQFRQGPLAQYGGWLLLGTLGLLLVFFILRGRIRLDAPNTGRTVTRFVSFERMTHSMLAGSFILLGVTGLLVLFGRMVIAPVFGKEANSVILIASKWIHNNVSWAFMLALILIFVMWVRHNLPNRTDLVWIAQFGGIIGKKHPPAKKFNAGQKLIFWSVIVLGGSISVSGLSLLFPFELPLMGKTFVMLNEWGIPGWFGMAPLETALTPQEEMQLTSLWHAIVAFVLMAIIIAHIYIGSLGMEGAYDAMGSGEVDEAWAHQHHSLWLDEVKTKQGGSTPKNATPAE